MPSVEQVAGTLPHAFKDKYPSTFAIIDGIFFLPRDTIRSTPSVLNVEQLQAPQYRQVPGSLYSKLCHLFHVSTVCRLNIRR